MTTIVLDHEGDLAVRVLVYAQQSHPDTDSTGRYLPTRVSEVVDLADPSYDPLAPWVDVGAFQGAGGPIDLLLTPRPDGAVELSLEHVRALDLHCERVDVCLMWLDRAGAIGGLMLEQAQVLDRWHRRWAGIYHVRLRLTTPAVELEPFPRPKGCSTGSRG